MWVVKKAKLSENRSRFTKAKLPKAPTVPTVDDNRRDIFDDKAQSPRWQQIHQIADSKVNEISDHVVKAAKETQKLVNQSDLVDIMAAGDNPGDLVDWEFYRSQLDSALYVLRQIVIESASKMKIHLPPEFRGFKFDPAGARISEYGEQIFADWTERTRLAFLDTVRTASTRQDNLGLKRAAGAAIATIGLTKRLSLAVINLQNKIATTQVKKQNEEQALQAALEYANKLVIFRALRFGRHESIRAANHGYMELVEQGIDDGAIPKSRAKKTWIVTPDDRLCPWCAPMADVTIPVGDLFSTGYGMIEEPPMHVLCRCSVDIVFS